MKLTKRFLALLLIFAAFSGIPVLASEPEAATLPPIFVGVVTGEEVPESWNPLEEVNPDQRAILTLTAEPLYRVAESTISPAQASALPVDVTAEYAGSYGIPKNATRGYAFAIDIREDACWEDGKTVNAADWYFTVNLMLEAELFPLELANYRAFLRGDTKPSDHIVSLQEAGFSSVSQAEAAGHTDFYIDITHFWGLDAGWLRITDRAPLLDAAIPSGCEEMYLTAEYLYRNYLSDTGSQKMFQSEFVGIPVSEGEKLTMADVGLVAEENRLTLILREPAAVSYVAATLAELVPVRPGSYSDHYGTAGSYTSCGPYRIVSVGKEEILLEPNPHWTGASAEFEILRFRQGG